MSYRNEAERIAEAKRVQILLQEMDAAMPEELRSAQVAEAIGVTEERIADVKKLKSDYTAAVEAKNNAFKDLRDLMKRIRSGAKAIFGDDSLEYERVGGKRASEIKRSPHKAASSAA